MEARRLTGCPLQGYKEETMLASWSMVTGHNRREKNLRQIREGVVTGVGNELCEDFVRGKWQN